MKKLYSDGFTHSLVILAFITIFAVIGVGYFVYGHAQTPTFTYLATHPQASQQTTALGKTIYTLRAWNNKIYSGYGDYGANTGPIAITPFDPTTNSFATSPELIDDQTEAIGLFRILGSKLVAPSTDPRGGVSTDYASATLTNGAASWKQTGPSWPAPNAGVGLIHAFDMATLTGSDMWIVGAQGSDSVAYRNLDGGSTWAKMLDVIPPAGKHYRFYAAGVYNAKLYLEAMIIDDATNAVVGSEGSSHVYNGTAWIKGPNLTTNNWWHPETFNNKMVYTNWANPDNSQTTWLSSFDGSSTQSPSIGTLFDYTIDGGTLYTLESTGAVYSTTDLTNWYMQSTAPATARSIAVANGQIYVGTTDSKLYSAPVNTAPTVVSTTTTTARTHKPHTHVIK